MGADIQPVCQVVKICRNDELEDNEAGQSSNLHQDHERKDKRQQNVPSKIFIDAMEYIVKQVIGHDKGNKLDVMRNHIDNIIAQLPE